MLWLTLLGMKRRRLLGLWPSLPLLPLYYLLMSVAAWAALYDLAVRPFHWRKTEHGLARTRRRPGRVGARRAPSFHAADHSLRGGSRPHEFRPFALRSLRGRGQDPAGARV